VLFVFDGFLSCACQQQVARPKVAQDYLSEEAFPGLHVIECEKGGENVLLYRRGQKPASSGSGPSRANMAHVESFSDLQQELERLLHIPEREPLQSPWALFDAQGGRIESLDELEQVPVAFLLEIGQWMWPAVRIGFEQVAEGVNENVSVVLRTLSLRPVVFEVRDFISKSEAEKVMKIGMKQGLRTSEGVLQSSDLRRKTKHSSFRTSRQTWLDNNIDRVVGKLDARTARLTRIPASHNEPVQLLRYDDGQYYHSHMDWVELELYPDQKHIWIDYHFGHEDRLATVFWYLNDVEEGGETIFPKHGQPICDIDSRGGLGVRQCDGAQDPDMSSCEVGLKVPPRRGTAILWYNFHPSGRGDRNALHAGCPVGANLTKWSANKWVHIKPNHAQGSWIHNHPAMIRHGWVDKLKSGATKSKVCHIEFGNEAGVVADVMWLDESGSGKKIATLRDGESSSQESFNGHKFLMASGKRKSNVVTCKKHGGVAFVLNAKFQLRRAQDEL